MMNSITRMIFEHTYEATVDADIIPEDTRDTRTDVFTLMCFFDSEIFVSQKTWCTRTDQYYDYTLFIWIGKINDTYVSKQMALTSRVLAKIWCLEIF